MLKRITEFVFTSATGYTVQGDALAGIITSLEYRLSAYNLGITSANDNIKKYKREIAYAKTRKNQAIKDKKILLDEIEKLKLELVK